MLLAGLMAGPVSADTSSTCGSFDGDLELTGDCDLFGDVDGNIKIKDGTLRILGGSVNGDIEQEGSGDVWVGSFDSGGSVDGNIKEKDDGNVNLGGVSTVNGNVDEEGSGDVNIFAGGVVEGNVSEKDDGTVNNSGSVEGNVEED